MLISHSAIDEVCHGLERTKRIQDGRPRVWPRARSLRWLYVTQIVPELDRPKEQIAGRAEKHVLEYRRDGNGKQENDDAEGRV